MVVAVGDFFERHRANWDDPSHDRAGNRLWREDSVADANSIDKDELYTYDGSYRLTELQRGDVTTGASPSIGDRNFRELWALDATGNWEMYSRDKDGDATLGDLGSGDELHGRCHNKANEITSINKYLGQYGLAWSAPAHDRAGNMTIIPQPAAPSDHYHLDYDAWNRLVTVKAADDSTLIAAYEYDGLNCRTVKEVYASGSLDEVRHFYYSNQWQVLEERAEVMTGSTGGGVPEDDDTQYVWGRLDIDNLILRDRDADTSSGNGLEERLYTLQDANWNVVALAESDGDIIERFIYDAYGKATPLAPDFTAYSGTDYCWEYLFTGRRLDEETGLMYYRNRYYHMQLGRFVARDTLFDTNKYLYCEANPALMADPLGLKPYAQVGLGAHFYRGVGGGADATITWTSEDCCDAAGVFWKDGIKTQIIDLTVEIGIGIGVELRIFKKAVSVMLKGPQLVISANQTCKSECNKTIECCKACGSGGIDTGLMGLQGVSLGIIGFSVNFSGNCQLQAKHCYNSGPGCTRQGYALGVCSSASIDVSIDTPIGLGWTGNFYEDFGCKMLVGTENMLKT